MGTTGVARARWAALGAAVAVSLGAGGLLTASASVGSGERAVFVPITPCRLFDTRPTPDTVGPRSAPLGPNDTHTVTVWGANGNCNLPVDATGVVMNVAVIAPSDSSFLTVFPAGATRPLAANLNWVANDAPKSNAVTVDVSSDGRISFYNLAGNVHVAADIVGYFVDHHFDDRYYTKGEVYSKAEVYAKAETYAKSETYSKAETDLGLATKVPKPTGAGSLIVDPAAFTPDSQSSGTSSSYFHGFGGGSFSGTGHGCFRTQVLLPNGVTVTSVSSTVFDNATGSQVVVLMYRNPVGVNSVVEMALGHAPGQPNANVTITDSTIVSPVIDNAAASYMVAFCLTTGLTFYDTVINFTYP